MDQPGFPSTPQQGSDQLSASIIDQPSSLQVGKNVCNCGSANCTCGSGNLGDNSKIASSFVYALGKIEPRFPSLGIEKEYAQATARAETGDLNDHQTLQKVLSDKQNRYLARQLCWVFIAEEVETYLLIPRDTEDLNLFIESLRPRPHGNDVDVIIGLRGPERTCNDLTLPTVIVDQLYSFDLEMLVRSMPRPEKMSAKNFEPAAEGLFMRVMRLANNRGDLDEHRALNYLVTRYPAIYALTAEAHSRNFAFSGIQFRHSRHGGARKIVGVVFSYTNRQTDITEKYVVRVDVGEEFPFLVTKPAPFFEM